MKKWCGVAVLLTTLVVGAASCPAVWADGDPASDVLVSQMAFVPADGGFSTAQQARLDGVLKAAAGGGHPFRVAIIPNSYDLGSITVLWKKPETYARFLGAELSLVYRQPLLVVMPNGLGLNWPGHSTAQARRRLAGLRVAPGAAGLVDAAATAVQRLLAADHVQLPAAAQRPPAHASPRSPSRERSSGTSDRGWLVIGVAVVALLGVVAGVASGARAVRPTHRWLLPGAAAAAVAVATPIAVVALVRGGSAGASQGRAAPGTLFMLPAGRQRAPAFALRDQSGQAISPASFRGRNVLITFVDPFCRNLCPLEAHVLNALVRGMPAARRPAIIAVSVDRWADDHHDLTQDFSKWSLVREWHWAIGSRAQLASVWRRYAIQVQVVTKHLAGTTVHYITHTEASYLIDPSGYERAMFAWPFSPQDVLATLHRIAQP